MAYSRRRKFKGTWLPAYGNEVSQDVQTIGIHDTLFTLDNEDVVKTNIIALLPDKPNEDFDSDTNSLADTIGSEYALRRIVGKFHAAFSNSSGTPAQNVIKLGLGFFVSTCNPSEPLLPIGTAGQVFTPATDEAGFEQYCPLALATIRQPWIWRRTWALQQPSGSNWLAFPASTAGYGSVMDGPHIDAKTRRRVRQDERLYAAVAISYFSPESDETTGDVSVSYDLDLRFFGALRRARAKGAF